MALPSAEVVELSQTQPLGFRVFMIDTFIDPFFCFACNIFSLSNFPLGYKFFPQNALWWVPTAHPQRVSSRRGVCKCGFGSGKTKQESVALVAQGREVSSLR